MSRNDQDYSKNLKDGDTTKRTGKFHRGKSANFLPSDETYENTEIIDEYFVKGTVPTQPFIERDSSIVAFGSCFAWHISNFLKERGYNVSTKEDDLAYISRMSSEIVNTYAVRQQFEWAWLNKQPQVELWHGYDAQTLGYDENVRLKTVKLLDKSDVFIITLGLSEVWYDELTREVFWRAIPREFFDPSRHKFRVSSVAENVENLKAIYQLIRERRPNADIVFTLSPIPLLATFRDLSCYAANATSKAILRAALDEFMRSIDDLNKKVFYFPSYEIVLNCFNNQFEEDRRHVHKHVLDFNMKVFEKYFCKSGITNEELLNDFRTAQKFDRRVGRHGHWSVWRNRRRSKFKPKKPPVYFRLIKAIEHKLERDAKLKGHQNG